MMSVVNPNLAAVRRIEFETGIEHVFNPSNASATVLKGALARGEALKEAIDTAGNGDTIILGTGDFILPSNIVIDPALEIFIRGIASQEPSLIKYRSDATNPPGFDIQSQVQFVNVVITPDTTFGLVTRPALRVSGGGNVQLNNSRVAGPVAVEVFGGAELTAFDSSFRGEQLAVQVGSAGTTGTVQMHDCRVLLSDVTSAVVTDAVAIDFMDGIGLFWDCNISAGGGTSSNTAIKVRDADSLVIFSSIVDATGDSVTNVGIEILAGGPAFVNTLVSASGDSSTNTAIKSLGGSATVQGGAVTASGGGTATNVAIETSNAGTALDVGGGGTDLGIWWRDQYRPETAGE